MLVVDGLGHGPDAAVAAREAVRSLRRNLPALCPVPRVEALNAALRATRGAAVAVAHIDAARKLVRFSGLGNIVGDPCTTTIRLRHLVSQHGIAGQNTRRIEEYSYPWTEQTVLVMHSDGINTRLDLAALSRAPRASSRPRGRRAVSGLRARP